VYRVINQVAVTFKGSGWYITDSKSSDIKTVKPKPESGESDKDAGKDKDKDKSKTGEKAVESKPGAAGEAAAKAEAAAKPDKDPGRKK
jgi:predicted nucleic acid-binding Zn ribbon protein